MELTQLIQLICIAFFGILIVVIQLINMGSVKKALRVQEEKNQETMARLLRENMQLFGDHLKELIELQGQAQKAQLENQSMHQTQSQEALTRLVNEKLSDFTLRVSERLQELEKLFQAFYNQTHAAQDSLQKSMQEGLTSMREENGKKLDEIRQVVDEKLQTTLESRIQKSFESVSKQLAEVYQGLGEMRNLAGEVGDLKRVLSNVKTRGILGETQLATILSEILTKQQYDENVATIPGSSERVEFAVRLPGSGDLDHCYLPIDSKFPLDTYRHLLDAYESGSKEAVLAQQKAIATRIQEEAKDISLKYIQVPYTTKFGILFLPIEGLYAEVLKIDGLVDEIQKKYSITIAGPTTLCALLNSLRMGFTTLQLQQNHIKIEKILGAAKTEFEKFGEMLASVQKNLQKSQDDLTKLIGTRTNSIRRALSDVDAIPDHDVPSLLGTSGDALLPMED